MSLVLIGSPVRNRAWVLPRHIAGIVKQRNEVEFQTCYIVNDCKDRTEEILQLQGFHYIKRDWGPFQTRSEKRGHYSYLHLALLRNTLLEHFLATDCEYLFSCDTDIIIPEGSLKKLIDHDKDIVSMVIRNHPTMMAHNVMKEFRHMPQIPYGLISCQFTGAVYLIKRKVIEAGVRYAYHPWGEDAPFCLQAREKGFQLFCDTTLQPIHAYAPGIDLVAKVTK